MIEDDTKTILLAALHATQQRGWFPIEHQFRYVDHVSERKVIDHAIGGGWLVPFGSCYVLRPKTLIALRDEPFARAEWGRLGKVFSSLQRVFPVEPGALHETDAICVALRPSMGPMKPNDFRRAILYLDALSCFGEINTGDAAAEGASAYITRFRMTERILDVRLEDVEKQALEALAPPAPPVPQPASAVVPPPPAARAAGRFGRWALAERRLGAGGQGDVELVFDPLTFERGALKRMNQRARFDDKGRARFLREVEAFRAVQHPFVMRVLDAGEEPEPFIVGEYVELRSLHNHLAAFKGDVWRCLRLARGIAQGLGAAHEHNIFHRDVKPQNILLKSYDHPLVADFGVAHFAEADGITSLDSRPRSTYFAPPESDEDGCKPTAAFDVFELGAVLHAMLMGEQPKRPYGKLKPIDLLGRPNEAVDQLIAKLLKENPEERPQSMQEVVSLIDETVDSLFRRTVRAADECDCSGRFVDLGTLITGTGTEIRVGDPRLGVGRHLSSLAISLLRCQKCGAIRLSGPNA